MSAENDSGKRLTRRFVNNLGSQVSVFERDGVEVGQMFICHHPTLTYEVFRSDGGGSRRVNNADEAEAFLTQQ